MDAPYVPARGIRTMAAHVAADQQASLVEEVEVNRVRGAAAVGGRDLDGHEPIARDGAGPGERDV